MEKILRDTDYVSPFLFELSGFMGKNGISASYGNCETTNP